MGISCEFFVVLSHNQSCVACDCKRLFWARIDILQDQEESKIPADNWGTTHLVKKLYNLTVQMACTVHVHVFYWLNQHLYVHAANQKT